MRLLVAGVGNIFFGDDGFGCEVVRVLAAGEQMEDATVADYGIRGMHLAYELASGYDRAILIDAVPRGGTPGSLYVIEPELRPSGNAPDAHRMDLENVFAFIKTIGAEPPPITIVGCEPSSAAEGMGLSGEVQAAVGVAAALVRRMVRQTSEPPHDSREQRSPVWTEA